MMKENIEKLYFEIWNKEKFNLIKELVADQYKINRDAGDNWEGKTLNHREYIKRVMYSKTAFPDLEFKIEKLIQDEPIVSVMWTAFGTQKEDLFGIPATGKSLNFNGQTIYEFSENKIIGHWQVMDRLGFYQQIQN